MTVHIFSATEPLTAKLGNTMVHVQELECSSKSWACYFRDEDHSEGLGPPELVLPSMSCELLNLLQPNLVWWCVIMSQSAGSKVLNVWGQGHRMDTLCVCSSCISCTAKVFAAKPDTLYFSVSSLNVGLCETFQLFSSRPRSHGLKL